MKKILLVLLCLVLLIVGVACTNNVSVVLNTSNETNNSNEIDETHENYTDTNLRENANISADIQTVRNMNTVLAVEFIDETPTDINAVIDALNRNGFNAEDNIVPRAKNHAFYWFSTKNVLVFVEMENDTPNAVIYPDDDELASAFMAAEDAVKYNLTDVVK